MIPNQRIFMEHLNIFNIPAGIKNFTTLLKSNDILLPVQHLKAVKCAVTVIFCVALDIEIQSSYPKESPLLDHVQKGIIKLFLFCPPQLSTRIAISGILLLLPYD